MGQHTYITALIKIITMQQQFKPKDYFFQHMLILMYLHAVFISWTEPAISELKLLEIIGSLKRYPALYSLLVPQLIWNVLMYCRKQAYQLDDLSLFSLLNTKTPSRQGVIFHSLGRFKVHKQTNTESSCLIYVFIATKMSKGITNSECKCCYLLLQC